MTDYTNIDWLLGGSYKETERRESFMETLSFLLGKFEAHQLSQEDKNDIMALDIYDELSQLEEALHGISDKLFKTDDSINEMSDVMITAIPAAIGSILGAIGVGSALFKTWMNTGSVLPKGLRDAEHTIGKWLSQVTGAEQAKRRAQVAEIFKKKNPNASPIEIKAFIARIEADEKARNERLKEKVFEPRKDLNVKGTVKTSFDRQRELDSMSDKEREEYFRKRFPNKHKKG